MSRQIMLRSINPLHILTVTFFALGIAYSIYNSPHKMLLTRDYAPALFGYLSAVTFHSLWNGSLAIQDANTRTIIILSQSIPVFNVVLFVAGLILFPFLLIHTIGFTDEKCPHCEEWHLRPFTEENHKRRFTFSVPFKFTLLKKIRRGKFGYSCPSCNHRVTHGKCNNCNATNLYICQRCKAPIPVHSQNCWNCNLNLEVVFEDVFSYKTDKISVFSQNMTYILAGVYIPSALTMLILIGQNSRGTQSDSTIETLGVVTMFLTLLGINILIIIQWLNNPQKLGMGFSLSRTLLAMIVFEIAIFFFAFSLSLFLSNVPSAFKLSGLMFFLYGTVVFWFGLHAVLNYRPLIHEIDNKVI